MSQGRFSRPLAPEDDWFDEPAWFDEPGVSLSANREESHEISTGDAELPRSSRRPPRRRRWKMVVAAVVGAVVLLLGGALVARALGGSAGADETTETTTSMPPTTTAATTTTATEPTTGTTETTTQPEDEALRPGDESAAVRQLQTDLVELGYSTGGIDGKYGAATERAVRDFQTSSGLVVDGVAGPATLAAVAAALNP